MIRRLAASLAALAAAAPGMAAEGGAIRSGEQPGFSRIVMLVEPTTEWSLETAPGQAIISFPGRELAFDAGDVFEKIPRDRITAVRTDSGPGGTRVVVDVGCDCRISTAFVGAQYLALDVSDRDAPPPDVAGPAAPPEPAPDAPGEVLVETPDAQRRREASIIASAEQVLIQQIERAVDQGIISLSDRTPVAEEPTASPVVEELALVPAEAAPPVRPEPPAAPPAPTAGPEAPPDTAAAGPLSALFGHDQIEATTVFDRDRRALAARRQQSAVPVACIADARIEVGRWSNGTGFFDQSPALMSRLLGEFDAPDPEALAALVRLNIRFGFGLEAELMLAGFDAPIDDRPLLTDLARAVEGRPLTDDGPLAMQVPCPGRHGLWQAIGGTVPAFRSAEHFATIQAAFGELPPDLRALVGPTLVDRLLDEARSAEARLILETVARPGDSDSAALRLSEARLAAAEGRPEAAIRGLSTLVETGAANGTDALIHLVQTALAADVTVPARTIVDLRAALLQNRGTAIDPTLRALLAGGLAARGELAAAIEEVRLAMAAHPAEPRFAPLAVELLAAADPAQVGPAAYAEVVLTGLDLIGPAPDNDAARRVLAEHLLDLGLAPAARDLALPAAARDDAARLTLAEALLRTGAPDKARLVLTGLAGAPAAALRARTHAAEGDFATANASLTERGLVEAAAGFAWPAGDWPQARVVAPSPDARTMAAYMAGRDGEPIAGEAPATGPAAAFLAPLPSLERASLASARDLLDTGRAVEDFVAGVLGGTGGAADPEAPAP